MLTAYMVSSLDDGSTQPLRCEFQLAPMDGQPVDANAAETAKGQANWELLTFNSDFEASFCVEDGRRLEQLVEAFNASDTATIISLLGAGGADVEPEILAGFLRQLNQLGRLSIGASVKVVHQYRIGRRTETLATLLQATEAEPLPLQAEFQNGELRSFVLKSELLSSFVEQIEGTACFQSLTRGFVDDWLVKDDTTGTLQRLVPPLRTEEVEQKLTKLRTLLQNQHGPFRQVSVDECQLEASTNRVRCTVRIEFADGTVVVDLEYVVDAFSAQLTAIEPRSD